MMNDPVRVAEVRALLAAQLPIAVAALQQQPPGVANGTLVDASCRLLAVVLDRSAALDFAPDAANQCHHVVMDRLVNDPQYLSSAGLVQLVTALLACDWVVCDLAQLAWVARRLPVWLASENEEVVAAAVALIEVAATRKLPAVLSCAPIDLVDALLLSMRFSRLEVHAQQAPEYVHVPAHARPRGACAWPTVTAQAQRRRHAVRDALSRVIYAGGDPEARPHAVRTALHQLNTRHTLVLESAFVALAWLRVRPDDAATAAARRALTSSHASLVCAALEWCLSAAERLPEPFLDGLREILPALINDGDHLVRALAGNLAQRVLRRPLAAQLHLSVGDARFVAELFSALGRECGLPDGRLPEVHVLNLLCLLTQAPADDLSRLHLLDKAICADPQNPWPWAARLTALASGLANAVVASRLVPVTLSSYSSLVVLGEVLRLGAERIPGAAILRTATMRSVAARMIALIEHLEPQDVDKVEFEVLTPVKSLPNLVIRNTDVLAAATQVLNVAHHYVGAADPYVISRAIIASRVPNILNYVCYYIGLHGSAAQHMLWGLFSALLSLVRRVRRQGADPMPADSAAIIEATFQRTIDNRQDGIADRIFYELLCIPNVDVAFSDMKPAIINTTRWFQVTGNNAAHDATGSLLFIVMAGLYFPFAPECGADTLFSSANADQLEFTMRNPALSENDQDTLWQALCALCLLTWVADANSGRANAAVIARLANYRQGAGLEGLSPDSLALIRDVVGRIDQLHINDAYVGGAGDASDDSEDRQPAGMDLYAT